MEGGRSLGAFCGLAAPAQEALSVCINQWDTPPPAGECRRYYGAMNLAWTAFSKPKQNNKKIKYEVSCRIDSKSGGGALRQKDDLSRLCRKLSLGPRLGRAACLTPADYVERLLKVEVRHTARPCWESFDFSGMVCYLASWLTACSWDKTLMLHELTDISKIRLIPVSNIDDSMALTESAIFISQMVSGRPASGSYWVLVAAAAAAGASVLTDRVILAGTEAPKFSSRGGAGLWQDLCDALRILADYYNRASGGEVFAFAMTKGIHHVSSVVAHSDEGGLTRDMLRECQFQAPYGGLPADCSYHPGMPTLSIHSPYSGLVQIVDSFALRTAAATAHCAPMMEVPSGGSRPFVIMGSLSEASMGPAPVPPPQGASPADLQAYDDAVKARAEDIESHLAAVRGQLEDSYGMFAQEYVPALAKLYGMGPSDIRGQQSRHWVQTCITEVVDCPGNRHLLKNAVLCPFFWIEPTSLLPRNAFGTVAEREGWASWGCGLDIRTEPWFDAGAETDNAYLGWRFYELTFEGARKCLWLQALQGHREDGLALAHFKRCDPELLMHCGPKVTRKGYVPAFTDRVPLSDYLWVRGQSSLPHPSEFTYYDRRVVLAICHYLPTDEVHRSAFPSALEMKTASVTATFSNAAGYDYGKVAADTKTERVYRSRGMAALGSMCRQVRDQFGERMDDGGYVMGVVSSPDRIRQRPRELITAHVHNSTAAKLANTAAVEDAHAANQAAAPGERGPTVAATAKPLAPALHGGTHTGPRLPQPAPVAVGGQAQQDGDGKQAAAGAAGLADGRGAAGVSPGGC